MKKVFAILVFLLAFTLVQPSVVKATSVNDLNNCPTKYQPDEVMSPCGLSYILNTNISVLTSLLIGTPGNGQSFQRSAAGMLTSGIDVMTQSKPLSLIDYVSYLGSRFHVPGTPYQAYAAAQSSTGTGPTGIIQVTPSSGGIGYASLSPLLTIWTTMRNLAYLFFAIVFIVIGVMIMMRSKVDPKTVLTVQSALPKIIIALVVVTFSYAIAGFMIDIMYVTISLIMTIAATMGFDATAVQSVKDNVLSGQPIFAFFLRGEMFATIIKSSGAIGMIVQSFFTNIMGVNGTGGQVTGLIAGVLTTGLAALVIAVAILWALFKTWLMLISAYANTILGIIFSPIQLAFDAIPGQNQLDSWIRNMMANLMAFPAVIIMIYVGMMLATNFGGSISVDDTYIGFVPPLLGAGGATPIQSLIGLAIILTIPKTVEMLQDIIKAPKNKWGTAWGEALKFSRDVNMAGGGWVYNKGQKGFNQLRSRAQSNQGRNTPATPTPATRSVQPPPTTATPPVGGGANPSLNQPTTP